MSLKQEKTENKNELKLTFTIEAAKFDEAIMNVFKQSAKYFNIPGFRKGKAPMNIVEKYYGKEIFYEDAFNEVVPDELEEALKENNIEVVTERILHNLILENIESFMKELGNSFSFIGSEYKIKIGDSYHKIDLLLFNIKYNSYVVVELKVTEFKAEYISQVQKYMNYIDKNVKEVSNNSSIGILICKKENRFVIEYCSLDSIVIREYELI